MNDEFSTIIIVMTFFFKIYFQIIQSVHVLVSEERFTVVMTIHCSWGYELVQWILLIFNENPYFRQKILPMRVRGVFS